MYFRYSENYGNRKFRHADWQNRAKGSLYRWRRTSEPANYGYEIKSLRTYSADNMKDVYFKRSNYTRHFKRSRGYDVYKPAFYPFRDFRKVHYERPSSFKWRQTRTKQRLDYELDCYMRTRKFKSLWDTDLEKTACFKNIRNSGVRKMNPIMSPFNYNKGFRYSRPSFYKWKRQLPTKEQLDYERDSYMSRIKYERHSNRRNGSNWNLKISYSQINSNFGVLKLSSPFRRFRSTRPWHPIPYRFKHKLLSKEQLNRELDDYMLERRLKRSSKRENREESACNRQIDYATPSITKTYSTVLPWHWIRKDIRHSRQYGRLGSRRLNKRKLDDELDDYMAQVNLKRICSSEERDPILSNRDSDSVEVSETFSPKRRIIETIVSPFRDPVPNARFQRPYRPYFSRKRRLPTKEQLDDDIDQYMAEVKYQSPLNRNYDTILDDVDLFLQEYGNETKKSLKLKETLRY